jgi:hypothetical protein
MPHQPSNFSLFLGDCRIGRVAYEDSDFPNVWGRLTVDETLAQPTTPTAQRIARFLELNRAGIRLVDVENERDVSAELAEINRQLESFNDYVETDDWRLVDDEGQVHPILCPIVRDGGEIVWRWNPRGEA